MLFYSLWFLASYIHVNSFPYLGPITTLIKSSWFVHACVLCSGEVEVKQAYGSEIFMGCFEWNTSLFKHLRDWECTLWGSIILNTCIPIQASLLVDLRCEEMLFHNVVFLEVLIACFTLRFLESWMSLESFPSVNFKFAQGRAKDKCGGIW